MFALLFDLEDYATTYRATRDAYLKAANELKLATGPYKAARDAYVAATATSPSPSTSKRAARGRLPAPTRLPSHPEPLALEPATSIINFKNKSKKI